MSDAQKLRRKAMRAYGRYLDCSAWLAEIKGGHDDESQCPKYEVAEMVKSFEAEAANAAEEFAEYVEKNGQ